MINRIKFLDGFRGIAVLLVVLFHMELNNFGFAGVELFFVISGFIITLLLLNEYDKNKRISIKNFFIRRINRLFPPLIATLIVVLIIFINFPIAGIENEVFSQATWTSLLASNWYEIIHQVGYWGQGVKSPLLHMWSLICGHWLWNFNFMFFGLSLCYFYLNCQKEAKKDSFFSLFPYLSYSRE